MNLILLEATDFMTARRVRLGGRRLEHLRTVHQAAVGDHFRVGLENGKTGSGQVLAIDADAVDLQIELTQAPPQPLPVTLLLALPRPKMLKRVLQSVSSLGVKQLYLINSYRVEKSFWGSSRTSGDC